MGIVTETSLLLDQIIARLAAIEARLTALENP
jgi:hypothetical protein